MIDLLRELCLADGVSGYEEDFLSSLAERIAPLADDVWFDRLGNLIAFKRGEKRPKNKVLFAAHADEGREFPLFFGVGLCIEPALYRSLRSREARTSLRRGDPRIDSRTGGVRRDS